MQDTVMMLDHPATRAVTPCGRAFYAWDIATDRLRWGGNCEPILDRAPWHMPDTLSGWLAVVFPADRPAARDAINGLLTNRQPIRVEYRIVRSDNRVIQVAGHAAFVADTTVIGSVARAGGPAHLVWDMPSLPDESSVGDVLGRDFELARFFDLSDDLLCIAGLDGYFRRVNPNFTRALGYSVEDLLAHPFIDFVHPEDVNGTRAVVSRLAVGQPVLQFINRFRTTTGRYRWIEWMARSVLSDGAIYAIGRDVTSRIELERQLQARVARERAILDNTPAVVYVKDCNGRYEFINARWARLFGVTPEGMVGKSDYDVFPAEFARAFQEVDQRVVRTGEVVQTQEVAPHADGQHTYLSVKFPVLDESGQVSAVAGISTDITDQLRTQGIEKEMLTARRVQQRLYPSDAPQVAGFDAAGRGLSASQLCGDYFDFVFRGERLVAVVGDVCGHGIGPALTMVEARATVRLLLPAGDSLTDILDRLNRQLMYDTGDLTFVSLFLAEVDLPSRVITYAGAGHEAHVVQVDGATVTLPSTGPLLGVEPDAKFEFASSPPLASGDILVLYTDGLIEAMNPAGEQFGAARALDVVRQCRDTSAREIVHTLFASVTVFTEDHPLTDDMTVIVLKAV